MTQETNHHSATWKVSLLTDPCDVSAHSDRKGDSDCSSFIAHVSCSVAFLFPENYLLGIREGGRVAFVAFADYVARLVTKTTNQRCFSVGEIRVEALDAIFGRDRKRGTSGRSRAVPFMFERSDVVASVTSEKLGIFLRVVVPQDHSDCQTKRLFEESARRAASVWVDDLFKCHSIDKCMEHIASSVLQDRLRTKLHEYDAVAFVSNGSILPRKSGACLAPMTSPPAIPFQAPKGSSMSRDVQIDLGSLCSHIHKILPSQDSIQQQICGTVLTLTGLLVPRGVTVVVGGGYHGKSTILRCLAAGVHNKIPGDGREFCVTVDDAVSIRAEDGRYVNCCNISAFISNLPIESLDTSKFSSDEASGSTSQAANTVEAIEMGASTFLVDEDISAANFMARDGRMRAMVMDESITPFLYRVNGLYAKLGISSIVVVGGVGDWLDVPNNVILMDKYLCFDATVKAQSVSKQFSHGHVQYAGRGLVHRLQWEKSGTPYPRRPMLKNDRMFCFAKTRVSLLDSGNRISVHKTDYSKGSSAMYDMELDDSDDEEHCIDMSRCEQLFGKKPQLYGCGLCVVWIIENAEKYPGHGLVDLLKEFESKLDCNGLLSFFFDGSIEDSSASESWKAILERGGYIFRPRRFEIGQAVTRWRAVTLEPIVTEHDDAEESAARVDADQKKRDLLEMWNSRRTT